uniref:HDC04774 n=1 Tax=Drosophila melanogaster TaxID=7227 RepID=Q6IGW5_DROME|nr:TPA_inf: HDC04774 [Drosophila melanogaster]
MGRWWVRLHIFLRLLLLLTLSLWRRRRYGGTTEIMQNRMATLPFGLPFWWSLLPDAQLTDWGVAEHTFSFAVVVVFAGRFVFLSDNGFLGPRHFHVSQPLTGWPSAKGCSCGIQRRGAKKDTLVSNRITKLSHLNTRIRVIHVKVRIIMTADRFRCSFKA